MLSQGGNLSERVMKKEGLKENEARDMFQQFILGLDYCHKMGVALRDIKLEVCNVDRQFWQTMW